MLLVDDARPLTHRLLPSLGEAAVWVFAGVTLVFVAIEAYVPARVLQQWRVDQLPPAGRKPKSRFDSAASLTLAILFLLWWVGALQFRDLWPEQAPQVEMAAVWRIWWWPILAFAVLEAGLYLLRLIRPSAARLHAIVGFAWSGVGAAISLGLLQAGHWVEIIGVADGRRSAAEIETLFNRGMHALLIGAIVLFGFCAAQYAWRLIRSGRTTVAA